MVEQEGVALKVALQVCDLTRSSYYYCAQSNPDGRKRSLDQDLVQKLMNLPHYEQTYGYRKATDYLIMYNHKKVYRHMKALNILQPKKLKKHHKKRLEVSCPIGSDIRWEGDLTYVFDGQRNNYLFAIVDAYDKEIIGDEYGLRCRAEEAVVSLEKAVKKRFGSLSPCDTYRVTLRVDQGSQYISKKFKQRADELGVYLEYCGIRCPNDKPYIESFFSRYKCEEVYRNEYSNYVEAFLNWIEYKNWYNTKRLHQGLGNVSIPQFKNQEFLLKQTVVLSKNIGA